MASEAMRAHQAPPETSPATASSTTGMRSAGYTTPGGPTSPATAAARPVHALRPATARYPVLYQVNPRTWLTELARSLGRPATLDDLPDSALREIAALGVDWLWLVGLWRIGPQVRRAALRAADLWPEYREALPDLSEADVCGSPFAIAGYEVAPELGGDAALARLRRRLADQGLRLMLDFIPNHVGLDHPWVYSHPEWLVQGSAADLARAPQDYRQVYQAGRSLILAHGRDPGFAGWTDTWQLDYSQPGLQAAMAAELARVAGLCDGLRCDMAMLVLPQVFEATWGRPAAPFWPAAIARARTVNPDLLLLAEVYWDLEWALMEQGFDFCYDKRLYDRLRAGAAGSVRAHLAADPAYQGRLARFVENHDEPRAAAAFAPGPHQAAALLSYLSPGLRLFHQGQFEGRRRRLPIQLKRWPAEAVDSEVAAFYGLLLALLADPLVRSGDWRLLDCRPAWPGNDTWADIVAFDWRAASGRWWVVTVCYADHPGQAYVDLAAPGLAASSWRLTDHRDEAVHARGGAVLAENGLYVDLPAWGWHVFELERA